VASYKELKIFGLNAPPAQTVAARPPAVSLSATAKTAAPVGILTPGSDTILYGAPKGELERDDSVMTFETCAGGERKDVKVNVAKAKQARKTPALVPGRSLVVYGSVAPDRVVAADRVDYGGDLPGQGPGCP
jgi:hypothetical protein